jgi:hypothetical protein
MAPCYAFISRPSLCVVTSRVVRSERYPRSNEVSVVVGEATEYMHSPRKHLILRHSNHETIRDDGTAWNPCQSASLGDLSQSRPTLTGNHPALTTLSTARAPTLANSTTDDGSVEHAFAGYLRRSSSTVLLQRRFDRHS